MTLKLYGEDAELAEVGVAVLRQPPKPLGGLILEVEGHSDAVPGLHFCHLVRERWSVRREEEELPPRAQLPRPPPLPVSQSQLQQSKKGVVDRRRGRRSSRRGVHEVQGLLLLLAVMQMMPMMEAPV